MSVQISPAGQIRLLPPVPEWAALPRAAHLATHIQLRDRLVFALLCEDLTIDQVAERVGPGITRRHIETVMKRIAYGVGEAASPATFRIRLVRIAHGIAPCWCEGS